MDRFPSCSIYSEDGKNGTLHPLHWSVWSGYLGDPGYTRWVAPAGANLASNLNSKTLFYKDCSLGSFKILSNN